MACGCTENSENSLEIKRKRDNIPCDDCVRKHLSTALIYMTEALTGYNHAPRAMAEIREAKREANKEWESKIKQLMSIKLLPDSRKFLIDILGYKAELIGRLNILETILLDKEDVEKIREIRKKHMKG